MTRRQFMKGGAAAFSVGFWAPQFVSDVASAQGATSRNLVVLYLSGGNDALSTTIPYGDPFYFSRRPTLAVSPAAVLQVGADGSGVPIGLHPRLTGLKAIYDQGNLAIVQRTGYPNSTRSHFLGTDVWSTGETSQGSGPGWIGRYLDSLPSPVDPLSGWNTSGSLPHTFEAQFFKVPAIPNAASYVFSSPNGGTDGTTARQAAQTIASHVPVGRPHLSFLHATSQAAMTTLDRVASVAAYTPTVTYPANGFGNTMKMIAGAITRGIGTKVFWISTGGYDTHSGQATNQGFYFNLMATLNDGLTAFYVDLQNQGALGDTLVVEFSEFGRRITENGSQGTDHGGAGTMLVLGGSVNGGLYGTAPNLNPFAGNPTLENNGGDVKYGVDFRSVYARVLDNWLGTNSVGLLGGDFRSSALTFV
ncbi:MAG: DUF1501 domain-containing protein [Vicinamibacterales bacterium]